MSRYDKIEAKDVASRNANADLGKVLEVERIIKQMRAAGISGRGFSLAPPFRRQKYTTRTHIRHERIK